MKLPKENYTYINEAARACLQYTREEGTNIPKLYVQVIDAYSNQLELIISWITPVPLTIRGTFNDTGGWRVHSYKHPGKRCIKDVSEKVAYGLMSRIVEIAQKYPNILFNDQSPVSSGFVHFHDNLLHGAEPSVNLIK